MQYFLIESISSKLQRREEIDSEHPLLNEIISSHELWLQNIQLGWTLNNSRSRIVSMKF